MRSISIIFSVLLIACPFKGKSQPPSAFPVEITSSYKPQPVVVSGQSRLVYELRLTNFSAKAIKIEGLHVTDGSAASLASYKGEEVEKLLVAVGPTDSAGMARVIDGGRSVVIFIDLTLKRGARTPLAIHHLFSLSIAGKDGKSIEKMVKGPVVPVIQETTLVLRAPLEGSGWVAFNGFLEPDHRRALMPIDGKVKIAQRFAIDWARVGKDGLLFHGDSKSNTSFYSYGAKVIAVANGRVCGLKDGLPDNIGSSERTARAVTLDNITGNYIIIDLGQGHFAFYAHLQPGSLKIKAGDKVTAGQVLGLLGNSGNSDSPHLHFQIMDSNSPLCAEGIPYVLGNYTQLGELDDPDALDQGKPWIKTNKDKPVIHRRDFPADNAVISFP